MERSQSAPSGQSVFEGVKGTANVLASQVTQLGNGCNLTPTVGPNGDETVVLTYKRQPGETKQHMQKRMEFGTKCMLPLIKKHGLDNIPPEVLEKWEKIQSGASSNVKGAEHVPHVGGTVDLWSHRDWANRTIENFNKIPPAGKDPNFMAPCGSLTKQELMAIFSGPADQKKLALLTIGDLTTLKMTCSKAELAKMQKECALADRKPPPRTKEEEASAKKVDEYTTNHVMNSINGGQHNVLCVNKGITCIGMERGHMLKGVQAAAEQDWRTAAFGAQLGKNFKCPEAIAKASIQILKQNNMQKLDTLHKETVEGAMQLGRKGINVTHVQEGEYMRVHDSYIRESGLEEQFSSDAGAEKMLNNYAQAEFFRIATRIHTKLEQLPDGDDKARIAKLANINPSLTGQNFVNAVMEKMSANVELCGQLFPGEEIKFSNRTGLPVLTRPATDAEKQQFISQINEKKIDATYDPVTKMVTMNELFPTGQVKGVYWQANSESGKKYSFHIDDVRMTPSPSGDTSYNYNMKSQMTFPLPPVDAGKWMWHSAEELITQPQFNVPTTIVDTFNAINDTVKKMAKEAGKNGRDASEVAQEIVSALQGQYSGLEKLDVGEMTQLLDRYFTAVKTGNNSKGEKLTACVDLIADCLITPTVTGWDMAMIKSG